MKMRSQQSVFGTQFQDLTEETNTKNQGEERNARLIEKRKRKPCGDFGVFGPHSVYPRQGVEEMGNRKK